jgi:hypothetical protein
MLVFFAERKRPPDAGQHPECDPVVSLRSTTGYKALIPGIETRGNTARLFCSNPGQAIR